MSARSLSHTLPHLMVYLLLVWLLGGCDAASVETDLPPSTPVDLTQPWERAAPAEVGLNSTDLAEAVQVASENPRILSLLVVRNGKLAAEEYFQGNHADSLNDVRSVTKSVLSTLIGVALAEGFIDDLDALLGTYIGPETATLTPEQAAITLRQLLTMTGGFSWNELNGNAYNTWISSDDHVQHGLNQTLANAPGTTFNYNSGAVHLLGVLLQHAVQQPLPEFADQYLFRKIGIQERRWERLTRGYVNGGSGIDLRPRDLARLGQFYLQDGRSGETQILPPDWTTEATVPRFEWRSTFGPLQGLTYGYLWWVEEGQPEPAFLAWGFGGQFIYVVPDLDLVVVATTNWRGGNTRTLEEAVLAIIIDHVVRAAR